jgi:hypothetical protein
VKESVVQKRPPPSEKSQRLEALRAIREGGGYISGPWKMRTMTARRFFHGFLPSAIGSEDRGLTTQASRADATMP